MELKEINQVVLENMPHMKEMQPQEFTAEEAEEFRLGKADLVREMIVHVGAENYMELSRLLHKKCFGDMQKDRVSRHVMHRVIVGTSVDLRRESKVRFVYDERDLVLEVLMNYIAFAKNAEDAKKIIGAIDANLESFVQHH